MPPGDGLTQLLKVVILRVENQEAHAILSLRAEHSKYHLIPASLSADMDLR